MNAPFPTPDRAAMAGHAFDAVHDAAGIAEVYCRTAVEFAAIGDARGVAYALRCASAALLTASQATEALRPGRGGAQGGAG